jgi:hypothetical protein
MLRCMVDNWDGVRRAHDADDLAFGIVGVLDCICQFRSLYAFRTTRHIEARQNLLGSVSAGQYISEVMVRRRRFCSTSAY